MIVIVVVVRLYIYIYIFFFFLFPDKRIYQPKKQQNDRKIVNTKKKSQDSTKISIK